MIPVGSSIQSEAVKVVDAPIPVETTTVVLDTTTSISEIDLVSVEVSLTITEQVDAYVLAKLAYWERRLHKLKYLVE